jgi:hypothetical protein
VWSVRFCPPLLVVPRESRGNGHARGPNQDRHLLLLRLLVWGRRQVVDALTVVVRVVVAGKQGGALRSSRRPDRGLLVSGAGAAGVGIEGVSLSGLIDEAPGLSTRSVRAYKPGEARRARAIRPVGAAPRRDSPRPRCGVATRILASIDLRTTSENVASQRRRSRGLFVAHAGESLLSRPF